MTRYFLLLAAFLLSHCAFDLSAQTTVLTGKVTDERGDALPGANVSIADTYDGATTDLEGKFNFKTSETGKHKLEVSYIGYETWKQDIELTGSELTFEVKLKEAFTELNTVVISAGGFGASDDKKAVILNPIDIVTIAGANGDIFGALNYLPGTTPVGEENGIFVRGGDNSETQTVIDELVVQKPFFSTVPDLPSRSRFNPFTFKGTFFSTGGYSAQYGQAMSSSLILSTQDMADTTSSGLNLTLVGPGAYHAHKFKRSSLALSLNYTDTWLLFKLNPQAAEWEIPPRSLGGAFIYRFRNRNGGLWKVYATYNDNKFVVKYYDPFEPENVVRTKLNNYNIYSNATYKGPLNDKWVVYAGISASRDQDNIRLDSGRVQRIDQLYQGKFMLVRALKNNSNLRIGGESQFVKLDKTYNDIDIFPLKDESFSALFAESEYAFSTKFAARAGVRGEYSTLLNRMNVAPRISLAYKTGKYSQASLAYGIFHQTPSRDLLLLEPNLGYENAQHYILNWQYIREKRTFRAEAYYKRYRNLTYLSSGAISTFYSNFGSGYSRGLDLFWRDQKTFKNTDYWISYSFLDTERRYREFPISAMPTFAANHTGSVVVKRFFVKLRSQIGLSYIFSSGRPYYNPNLPPWEFLSQRTPAFHSLNVNISYISTLGKNFMVIFASLNNVLGRNNIFGYRFSADGQYSTPIVQPTRRGFFIGAFIAFQ